jgi:hypothetical protein
MAKLTTGGLLTVYGGGWIGEKKPEKNCNNCSKIGNCSKQIQILDYSEEPLPPTGIEFGRGEPNEPDLIDKILSRKYKEDMETFTEEIPMLPNVN